MPANVSRVELSQPLYSFAIENLFEKKVFDYSRDPKSDHLKTGFIRNPDILKVGSNHSKTGPKCPVSEWFIQKPDQNVRFSNGSFKNKMAAKPLA